MRTGVAGVAQLAWAQRHFPDGCSRSNALSQWQNFLADRVCARWEFT